MKLIFLDLDGTLLDHTDIVSEKSHEAIRRARANGHKVFICTGRSESEVFENILSVGFDGMIYSNGANVIAEGEHIFRSGFSKEEFTAITKYLDAADIAYSIQNSNGLFASPEYIERFEAVITEKRRQITDRSERANFDTHCGKVRAALAPVTDTGLDEVNNFGFIANDQLAVDKLFTAFGDAFELYQNVVPVFGPFSGEIGLRGITKGTAIEKVAEYYACAIEDTIGVGDGANDFPMFATVGVSVGMENAPDIVKEQVDIITKSVTDDGVYHAFLQLELI